MKNSLFLLSLIFFFLGCSSKKNTQINSNSIESKDFIDQFLEKVEFKPNVAESLLHSGIDNCLSFDGSSFSRSEIKFITEQLENSLDKKWSAETFKNVTIINDEIIEQKGKEGFVSESGENLFVFSHPVYIRNGKYCIFYIETICGGICGQGSLLLYIKEDNKWRQEKEICSWIH